MSPTVVSLARMVDLALGTPEVGAVNFNVLHSLLHAVLQKLNIADVKADLPESDDTSERIQTRDSGIDRGSLSEHKVSTAADSHDPLDMESDSGVTGLRSASEMGIDQNRPNSSESEKKESIPVTRTPYHALEEKIERMERQLAALGALPSTRELMEMTTGNSEQEMSKLPRPVAEMWQSMQLSRKVDANTQGVSKLMSLVEDLMREMQMTRDANEEIKKKLHNVTMDGNKLNDLLNKMNELEKQILEFQERINSLPDEEFYNGFVTWAALEDALKGLKLQYENERPDHESAPVEAENTTQKTVTEASNQTDMLSRPTSRYQSRASTPGPSAQLQDLLERLGRLHEQHDALEERVEKLEMDVKNKANKDEFDEIDNTLKGPSSAITGPVISRRSSVDVSSVGMSDQLKKLLEEFETMRDAGVQDRDSLSSMTQALQRLQQEMDRMNKATQRLCDDVNSHKSDIQRLHEKTTVLDDKKADREFIINEINAKADKAHLDSKVNRNQFDLTCNELNQMITDLINKLLGTEGEFRNAVGQLSSDIDSKMDRLEFGPFRDELERQLRALANKLATLHTGGTRDLTEDEAAGIRKQLVQRFHCISCDRPVDMAPQKPQASLPGQPGLPENKSMRPYLVYDLDQIRQYARSHGGVDGSVADMYATARACGGSHTMTFPQRRITRLQHVSPMFPEDALAQHSSMEPSYIKQNNVEGSNTKLPNVYPQPSKSKSARRQQTASSLQSNPPAPGGNSRPPTARLTSRPVSADVTVSPRLAATPRSVTAAAGNRNGIISPLPNSGSRSPSQNVTIQLPKLTADDRQVDSNDNATRISGEDSLADIHEQAVPFLTEESEDVNQADVIPTGDDHDREMNGFDDKTNGKVIDVTGENEDGDEEMGQYDS